jgi:teichuronic acid biosynthesis glycosyltransferase TuaC
MTAPHVALLTTSYPSLTDDAAGHFVATEARSLARRARVTVLAPRAPRDPDPALSVIDLPHFGLCGAPGVLPRLRERPARALGLLPFVVAARRELQRLAPDRVVAHFALPWLLTPLGDLPVELVAHGSDVRLLDALPAALVRCAFAARPEWRLRAVSEALRRDLARYTARDVVVAPSPIDVIAPSRHDARRALGLDPGDTLLVTIARLVPEKRVDVALVASAPHIGGGGVHLVLGDGPERRRLAARFPAARFLGRLPRQRALLHLAAADALISASRHEGAPTVIREARALGVPVAAVPAGDLVAGAASDPGLWIATRDDAAALASALKLALAEHHALPRPPRDVAAAPL